jgi:DNA-binding XRE family transcriptional regulator
MLDFQENFAKMRMPTLVSRSGPPKSRLGDFLNFTLSTIVTESTVLAGLQPREVVRCLRCQLVQFRTTSDLCRRCDHPLQPPPRLDLHEDGAIRGKSNGLRFSADRELHSRTRTARELTIGRKLRELRDQRHLTQQEMAAKAGVPRTYISRIENARLLPGPVMLQRISEALQVGILDLLPKSSQALAGDDGYWATLSGCFVQLRPQEMIAVLSHVRGMIAEPSDHSLEPALTAR